MKGISFFSSPFQFNANSCPTSRNLLFFGGFSFPLGQKKVEHTSSSSSSSSPTKYARADHSHGLTVYIRPQTSSELGQKVHSYSHLLKSKLFTKEELAKLKKLKSGKKKTPKKKKNTTTVKAATNVRDLVAINDQERDRCRALLQIDHENSLIPSKTKKKIQKVKNSISTNVKNVTAQAKKKVEAAAKTLPKKAKEKVQKIKPTPTTTTAEKKEKLKPATTTTTEKKEKAKSTKSNTKPAPEQKVKAPATEKKKPTETKPVTPPPPPVKEVPVKKTTPPPPPPPPVQPPPPKSKREKAPPVQEEPTESLDIIEADDIEGDDKNNSVVGRAYHFVKNMFQLSDDILENNHTHEEDPIFSSTNEPPPPPSQQQHHRQSRKLLSSEDDDDDHAAMSIAKRQLLSVKTNKRSMSSKSTNIKGRKGNADANKPKVGWAYRYRISRYLAAQNSKRTGRGKFQQQLQSKKSSSSGHTKVSKRKLLELDLNVESNVEKTDQ